MYDNNDNNVKIIVLDKILSLRKMYAKVLEDYTTDILNIIKDEAVVSLEINQKVLELVTNLVSQRNLKEVIAFLEREISHACKMEETGAQGAITNEYRYLLIKSINQITQTYPETIPAVLSPLMQNFLRFEGKSTFTSLETILFIREVIEVHPEHR
jgi:coatomer subunit beta